MGEVPPNILTDFREIAKNKVELCAVLKQIEDNHKRNKMKVAIIFGVTGQDGCYLSQLLLSKKYNVIGVRRRASTNNTGNLTNGPLTNYNFKLVEGDVADPFSVRKIIADAVVQAEGVLEIYNLAAQSHVHTSFEQPSYTFDVNCKGVLNILEVIREYEAEGVNGLIKFYQASTSEMFGDNFSLWTDYDQYTVQQHYRKIPEGFEQRNENTTPFQDENTPFSPMSPYAVAKLAAHQLVNNYRKAYGIHGSCGILFNHESPYRGENFLTQKVCKYVAQLKLVNERKQVPPPLMLGNLDSYRDFGFAGDYVEAMWLMLQQEKPDDYVIATGTTIRIGDFVRKAFDYIGADWNKYVVIDKNLVRPSEVDYLLGDATKAKTSLGWKPKVDVDQLIKMMVDFQYARLQ